MPIINVKIKSLHKFLNTFYQGDSVSYQESFILERLEKDIYISALRDKFLDKTSNGMVIITDKGKSLRDNK